MPRKRNDDLAKKVFEKRNEGMSFTAIGEEFGVSKQRVQQIYTAEQKHRELSKSIFYQLTEYTRRQIIYQLQQKREPSEVTPQLVAENLFEGDLRSLGNHVYLETTAWLLKNGYSIKDGFVDFQKFNGTWKAVTTHWPDGRRAPWVKGQIYDVVALNRSIARVHHHDGWFEVRLDYLKLGFERIVGNSL